MLLSFHHFENHLAWLSSFFKLFSLLSWLLFGFAHWVNPEAKAFASFPLVCLLKSICLLSALTFMVIFHLSSTLFSHIYLYIFDDPNLKSVPPYSFFCPISIYFAYCSEINYRVLISNYHSPSRILIQAGSEPYIKITDHAAAFGILDQL